MKKAVFLSVFLTLFISSSSFLYAQNANHIEEKLSADELITASLTASGVSEEDLPSYLEKISLLTENFREFIKDDSPESVAEKTLEFMYQNILEKYNSSATTLTQALDEKTYNCVTSSILYLYFSKIADFPCTPIQTPNHTFCEVQLEGKTVRVETTNPYGFDPGTRKPSSNGNRYYVVPAKNYQNKQAVPDKILVFMIYNNRVSGLFRKGKNLEALPLAEANLQFMGECRESIKLLQDVTVNILSGYINSKDFDGGLEFARDMNSKYGLSSNGKNNVEILINQASWKLQDAGQFEEALSLIESYADLLDEKTISKMKNRLISNQVALIHNDFARYFNKKQFAEAKEVLRKGIAQVGEDKSLLEDLNYALKFAPDEE